MMRWGLQLCAQGRREGGRGGGQLAPGPKQVGSPQLEKYPKIEQGPIKIGASTRHYRLHLKALKARFRGILNALEYFPLAFS